MDEWRTNGGRSRALEEFGSRGAGPSVFRASPRDGRQGGCRARVPPSPGRGRRRRTWTAVRGDSAGASALGAPGKRVPRSWPSAERGPRFPSGAKFNSVWWVTKNCPLLLVWGSGSLHLPVRVSKVKINCLEIIVFRNLQQPLFNVFN